MKFISIIILLYAPAVAAQDNPFRATNLPLPRFVSLGADEVNVRTGPGQGFPVKWVFRQDGLPVEIILEYEGWRKIRDHEGEVGWVHRILLSGKRSALVRARQNVSFYRRPDIASAVMAHLEPGVLLSLERCDGVWCKAELKDSNGQTYKGWVEIKYLWGVYEAEDFD
jgi:SH3-like domain-containing protein